MIQTIKVVNSSLDEKTFVYEHDPVDFIIKNQDGLLDPVGTDLNTFKNPTFDGVELVSTPVGARNIVLTLGYSQNSSKTVFNRRQELYTLFRITDTVTITVFTANGSYLIEGVVETVTPNVFTREPTLQVSIMCLKPHYKKLPLDVETYLDSGSGLTNITYEGEVATGFGIRIHVYPYMSQPSGYGGNIAIRQLTPGEPDRRVYLAGFDVNKFATGGIEPGDIINISTVAGERSATLSRGSNTYNILGAIRGFNGAFLRTEDWPLLKPGVTHQFQKESTAYSLPNLTARITRDFLVRGL